MTSFRATYFQRLFDFYRFNPTTYFIPYLILYGLWWSLSLNTRSLIIIFNLLHFLNLGLILIHIRPKHLKNREVQFYSFLFLLFLIPGAYLEYPSDPWEHFRRITNWNVHQEISTYQFKARFSYFWSWSGLIWFPAEMKRCAAHFLSAFSQTFLCYQLIYFVRKIGFKDNWDYLAVFSFVALFGTNLFGIRYYALSPFPFAYAAYFAILISLIDIFSGKRVSLGILLWNFLFAILNHPQTSLFLGTSVAALLILKFIEFKKMGSQKILFLGSGITLLGGVLGFIFLKNFPQLLGNLDASQVSRFGVFKIWKTQLSFFQTLGVHGVFSIVLGLVYFRRNPILASLTLFPIWGLIFAPIVLLTAKIHHVDTPYRILYSFPTCFMLLYGLQRTFSLEVFYRFSKKLPWCLAIGVILIFGFLYPTPYRGRLYFQLYQAPPERELKFLDPLIRWISQNRDYARSCWIITEDATAFLMDTLLGRENYAYSRLPPLNFPDRLYNSKELVDGFTHLLSLDARRPICGILVGNPNLRIEIPESFIAKASNHWLDQYGDFNMLRKPLFSFLLPVLEVQYMWSKYQVPPFFDLYEPIEKVIPKDSSLFGSGVPRRNKHGMFFEITPN